MTIRSLARLGTLASLALGLITVSFAQEKSGDDVAQMKAQLAAQQKQIEAAITGGVIHNDDFVLLLEWLKHRREPVVKRKNRRLFVVNRDHNG